MTPPPREPDELLTELGRRLDHAYAQPRPPARRRLADLLRSARAGGGQMAAARQLRAGGGPAAAPHRRRAVRLSGRRRWIAAGAALALLGGPTAVATHDSLFSSAPPTPPDALTGPGAVTPDATGTPVQVASGVADGVAWRLSASTCRYGRVQAVGLFLDVPGGGAGARCDVASSLPGAGRASARTLGARRVQAYLDPVADRTWVFGALPAGAATVSVRTAALAGGAASTAAVITPVPVDARALTRGAPAGLRVFAVALPGARRVTGTTVIGASGRTLLRCDPAGLCTATGPSHVPHEEPVP